MRFAICTELFENWDFARQCTFAAEAGYTGLELAPFTLAPRITDVSAETRQTMRRQAEDAGVEIIGLHWLLAKTEGLHLTSPEQSVRAGVNGDGRGILINSSRGIIYASSDAGGFAKFARIAALSLQRQINMAIEAGPEATMYVSAQPDDEPAGQTGT